MRESKLEAKLVEAVESLGGKCLKWTAPGMRGVPDRMVMFPGRHLMFVELKSETGRTRPWQTRFMKRLSDMGFAVRLVRNEDDLNGLVGEITDWLRQRTGYEAVYTQ